MRILEHLTLLSPGDLIPYAEALTASMALLLEPTVPRRLTQTLNKLWMGLNTVMPRRYMFWIRLSESAMGLRVNVKKKCKWWQISDI